MIRLSPCSSGGSSRETKLSPAHLFHFSAHKITEFLTHYHLLLRIGQHSVSRYAKSVASGIGLSVCSSIASGIGKSQSDAANHETHRSKISPSRKSRLRLPYNSAASHIVRACRIANQNLSDSPRKGFGLSRSYFTYSKNLRKSQILRIDMVECWFCPESGRAINRPTNEIWYHSALIVRRRFLSRLRCALLPAGSPTRRRPGVKRPPRIPMPHN